MAKSISIYACSKCDAQSPKWSGRCLECGEWGSLQEQAPAKIQNSKFRVQNLGATSSHFDVTSVAAKVQNLGTLETKNVPRLKTGINELDKVLGGGIVPGSLILLGGEPGIGKSTLLLQVAASIGTFSTSSNNIYSSSEAIAKSRSSILYASGEESAEQLKSRFDRLRLDARNIQYLGETGIESICGTIMQMKPSLTIVDSIQMVSSNESDSAPGSMSQIKIVTAMLAAVARETQLPIIVVGHVTKDGALAGPKTLEHLVDVVLEFSGDRSSDLRILRSIKNRFGSTGEMAFFEMTSSGLTEVPEPSKLLLAGKIEAPGSVTGIVLEGSRPLAVEFQSLLNRTNFGYPKRQAVGFDLNKLQLLAAVIAKRTSINMSYFDAHLKIVGGVRVTEPGADLPVVASMISAIQNKTLPQDTVIIGEVGLTGEVRPVPQMEKRLEEAAKLGFKNAIVPNAVLKTTKLKLLKIKNVSELLNLL